MRDDLDRELLARVMAAMAAGDMAAILMFIDNFGDRIAGVMRHLLSEMGHRHLAADDEEVEGLVLDATFVIFDRSGSWSPEGGALPWVWAHRALRALVASHIGHASVPFESERHDATVRHLTVSCAAVDFGALADGDPTIGLLRTAIAEVASERDAAVHVEYQLQKACGDPSPSQTVATMTGLSHANVRQIDRRVRQRLERLAHSDGRFAPLLETAWLDPDGARSQHVGAADLVDVA